MVADVTAVVPISQITLDVTAAQLTVGNRAAPMPQSTNGFGPEPGAFDWAKDGALTDTQATRAAVAKILIFIFFILPELFIIPLSHKNTKETQYISSS
jgi:hypothetical protein